MNFLDFHSLLETFQLYNSILNNIRYYHENTLLRQLRYFPGFILENLGDYYMIFLHQFL
jgi:hypothetical protein